MSSSAHPPPPESTEPPQSPQHAPHQRPSITTSSAPTQDEAEAIAKQLQARRRSSLAKHLNWVSDKKRPFGHPGIRSGRPRGESAVSEGSGIGDEVAVEEEEEESEEAARRVNTVDMDAYLESVVKRVAILGGESLGSEHAGEIDPEKVGVDPEPEFVWDVLFENQRGIYLWGTGYYSSRTLLPMDPSPFTRPCRIIPSASSFSISKPSSTSPIDTSTIPTPSSSPKEDKQHAATQSTKTTYTLETYQPPPGWEYITGWMINMRTGTDEVGWRYNAWFKEKGWSSHAGNIGWWGWVRRREWVRLRCVVPVDKEGEKPKRQMKLKKRMKIGRVFAGETVEDNLYSVLAVMGQLALDRERLDTWRRWLGPDKKPEEEEEEQPDEKKKRKYKPETEEEKRAREEKKKAERARGLERLKELCADETAMNSLRRQFTYPSSAFRSFLAILRENDVAFPETFNTPPPSAPPSIKHSCDDHTYVRLDHSVPAEETSEDKGGEGEREAEGYTV
ncbi:hypothetical protein IAT38_002853 [Cryptococcus sp. DSM 104549]